MKWYRIWAVSKRHLYLFPRSMDRITDLFYWPILEVVLYGYTGEWMTGESQATSMMIQSLLTCLIFWRIMWMASYETGLNIVDEGIQRNIANVLSSPLMKQEWVIAGVVISFIKLIFMVLMMFFCVWLFYDFNILSNGLGWYWLPFMMSAAIFGWTLGFATSSIILKLGLTAQAFSWTFAFFFVPISASYFPLELFPQWVQYFSLCVPVTYIFEATRSLIISGTVPQGYVSISVVLNIAYLVLALMLFNYVFERTRQRGFDHLE